MNCKPGDLAIVVFSVAGNEGKIVRCLRMVGQGRHVTGDSGPAWEVAPELKSVTGSHRNLTLDAYLRPIRDPGDDAVDESKAWLPPVPLPTIEPHLLEVGK
jgi:hypothetical protein